VLHVATDGQILHPLARLPIRVPVVLSRDEVNSVLKQLTGKTITDGALSQRRTQLQWQVFESLMEAALSPKAKVAKHPEAFYQGLRLCGLDGSRFSVANTPQVKAQMSKANSRRMKAAFAKVGVAVLVELGIHNPIAAAIGAREESEMVLAEQLIDRLPEKSLLISDRYYGVPKLLITFREIHPSGQREFLVRARGNIKMMKETRVPGLTELAIPNVVPRLTDTPGTVEWLGPALGAHTEAVLKEMTSNLIPNARMVAAGVVGVTHAQEYGFTLLYVG